MAYRLDKLAKSSNSDNLAQQIDGHSAMISVIMYLLAPNPACRFFCLEVA